MGVLAKILAQKQEELPALRALRLPPPPALREVSLRRDRGRLRLITEIKRRSPSAGELSRALSITERARAYERSGSDMLSVLCDTRFFDGAYPHLAEARAASALPILCKEFVIDEVQLDCARAFGADAVLLIARCVSSSRLRELVAAAKARSLVPFVEVADEAELEQALSAGAELIGVNARDLDTLVMDAERAQKVVALVPRELVCVHLSGLSRAEDVTRIAGSRADAALVGEALMRADDPAPLLDALVSAARARPSSLAR